MEAPEALLLNMLLHAFLMEGNDPQNASKFSHPSDDSCNVDSFLDFNLVRVCSILHYAYWRSKGTTFFKLSQEEQSILNYLVHLFLVVTKHTRVDEDFLQATGLTTAQEQDRIRETIFDYSMAKNHREVGNNNQVSHGNAPANLPPTQVGNNNRVSHGNAPANLPPTQVGLTLGLPHPSVPRYYPNFTHAEPPFRNQQYHDGLAQAQAQAQAPSYSSSHYHRNLNAGGLSPAQQYQYRPFLQTDQPSQNMQYDGHMFPSQYMMERYMMQRAANSIRASTAGQSHANSMRISTAGQSSGLSDSAYQFSNSQKHRRL